MKTILDAIKSEPVLVTALLQAALTAAAAFGLHLDDAQIAGVLSLSGAVLAFVARSQVTPVTKAPEAPATPPAA